MASEMTKLFGETRELEFNGKTYTLKRLPIGQFPNLAAWVAAKKRAPYLKAGVNIELAAKVLGEIDGKLSHWWECLADVSAGFFVVYLALKDAMIGAGGAEIRISEAIVQANLEMSHQELAELVHWLCSVPYGVVDDKDGAERPLDAASAGQ